jgi:hypothetical protein
MLANSAVVESVFSQKKDWYTWLLLPIAFLF